MIMNESDFSMMERSKMKNIKNINMHTHYQTDKHATIRHHRLQVYTHRVHRAHGCRFFGSSILRFCLVRSLYLISAMTWYLCNVYADGVHLMVVFVFIFIFFFVSIIVSVMVVLCIRFLFGIPGLYGEYEKSWVIHIVSSASNAHHRMFACTTDQPNKHLSTAFSEIGIAF